MNAKLKSSIRRFAFFVIPVRFFRKSRLLWREVSEEYRQEEEFQALLSEREQIIQDYLKGHEILKLQIGTGTNPLNGWLNTDLEPVSGEIIYQDALARYPYDNLTFDYIFSEHMIEHVSYLDGLSMLRECHRVLKPGGKIRIATPNIERIIGIYAENKTQIQQRYIEWSTTKSLGLYSAEMSEIQKRRPEWAIDPQHMKRFFPDPGQDGVCFVVNNFFRSYGHKFIYDARTLGAVLQEAGFTDVKQYAPGESQDENLRGLESHDKLIGDEMNLYETMVLEAFRP